MGNSWSAAVLVAILFVLTNLGGCTGAPDGTDVQASATDPAADANAKKAASAERSTANLLHLAQDIEARGSIATALPLYERAAAANDADPATFVLLGEAYLKVNRNSDAADAFRKALAKAPNNPKALFGLGSAELRLGQVEAALTTLQKAAPLVNVPQAYDKLGVAHVMSGQPREALASFEQAHSMDATDPDIATNLALAAALMGQYTRAIGLAQRTLANSAIKPYHRRNLILALSISGEPGQAEQAGAGNLSPTEVKSLLDRAEKIRQIPEPGDRALALGTVRLASTAAKAAQ
jgi:tetratricopeptide (TPR) repeat protein